MPMVFKSDEELAEFLEEVLEKAIKNPEYVEKFKKGSVTLSVELSDIGVYTKKA
ncbi:hypothetical protein [Thermococcus sp. Bubb.Bath]|uniref:hypothetical protein n=1 Tax=Thermococcus sp. Bubb.Bath TaxID=1638242 RepID=UPI00143B9BB9|nr:hypothetical protein [Thermococcus sp. Bubb.Bath]